MKNMMNLISSDTGRMTPEEHLLLKSSWNAVKSFSQLGNVLYHSIFSVAPSVEFLFFYSTNLPAVAGKIIEFMNECVELMDRPEQMMFKLRELAEGHASRGIGKAEYPAVEQALILTVAQIQFETFSDSLQICWGKF